MHVDENEKQILILGGSGFIAHWIVETLSLNHNFFLTYNKNRQIVDYSTEFLWFNYKISNDVEKILNKTNPDIVINLIKSGLPEKRYEKNLLFKKRLEKLITFNRKLVKFLNKNSIFSIFLSTDYVFDGISGPYNEKSSTSPVTNIGRAYNDIEILYKTLLDKKITAIVRSSQLLGNTGPCSVRSNFIDYFNSENNEIKKIKIFKDFYRTPSHVLNFVFLISRIFENNNTSGIFHVPGEYLSYEELIAKLIGRNQSKNIIFQTPDKDFFPNKEVKLGLNSSETTEKLKFKSLSLKEGFKFSKDRIY